MPNVTVKKFGASWCGPCRMIAPVLVELDKFYAGKVVVEDIDIDDNPDAANAFGVRAVPTTIILKDGVEAQRIVGFQTLESLKKKVNEVLQS